MTTQNKIIEEAKSIKGVEDAELLEVVKEILTQVNIEDLKRTIETIEKEL